MATRRDFLTKLGIGAASSLALASLARGQQPATPAWDPGTGKPVRVGIIGAENSHAVNLGRVFNIEKRFPGVEAVAIWGEREDFAKMAADKGRIPRIVQQQEELLGMIDALIVDHRHAKYHLEAALPFIKTGMPTFIDKPFCYRHAEGRDFLELARHYGAPVTSLSTAAFGPTNEDIAAQVRALDHNLGFVMTGRADIHSPYGGIFFYGIHTIEKLFKYIGDEVETVRATRHGDRTTVQLKYQSGPLVTILFEPAIDWALYSVRKDGIARIDSRVKVEDSLFCYADIVRMFQTGREPRTHDAILKPIAVLEAIERSLQTEDWELPPA